MSVAPPRESRVPPAPTTRSAQSAKLAAGSDPNGTTNVPKPSTWPRVRAVKGARSARAGEKTTGRARRCGPHAQNRARFAPDLHGEVVGVERYEAGSLRADRGHELRGGFAVEHVARRARLEQKTHLTTTLNLNP
jgi:hypothetical protein